MRMLNVSLKTKHYCTNAHALACTSAKTYKITFTNSHHPQSDKLCKTQADLFLKLMQLICFH